MADIRITEKRRLDTAAPAIKHKMVRRRRPRVFLPVLPLNKGSTAGSMAGGVVDQKMLLAVQCRQICWLVF